MHGAFRHLGRLIKQGPTSPQGCLVFLVTAPLFVFAVYHLSHLWGWLCGMIAIRWPAATVTGILSCVALCSVSLVWIRRTPFPSKLRKLPTVLMAMLTAFWMGGFCFSHYTWSKAHDDIRLTWDSPSLQFPLFEPEAIALGPDDEIYCISRNYSRLQVFDKRGRFRRSWLVPVSRGTSFRMRMEDKGQIRISTRSRENLYDTAGQLLSSEHLDGSFDNQAGWPPQQTTVADSEGNTYSLRKSLLSGKVLKTSPDGVTSVFLKNSFWQWLAFPGPFFTWLFGGIAGVTAFVFSRIL